MKLLSWCVSAITVAIIGGHFEDYTLNGWKLGLDRDVISRKSVASRIPYITVRNGAINETMISETMTLNGQQNCFEFFYYYKNKQLWRKCLGGIFKVEADCGSGNQEKYNSKQMTNEQSGNWMRVAFSLPGGDCKMRFTVTQTSWVRDHCGDTRFAIDDVKVTPNQCSSQSSSLLTCGFFENTCFWKASGSIKEWKMTSDYLKTKTENTGPIHRLEYSRSLGTWISAKYIYVDASLPNTPNKRGILESPVVSHPSPQCLRMFVNMNGRDVGKLIVSTVSNGNKVKIFEIDGNQDEHWFEKRVNLPVNTPYKVVIEADTATGIHGDIAIDNVEVQDGQCGEKMIAECDLSENILNTIEVSQSNACELKKLSGNNCTVSHERESIHSKISDVLSLNYKTCPNARLKMMVKIPGNTTTTRKSCLSLDYRSREKGCHLGVHQFWVGSPQGTWMWKARAQLENKWKTLMTDLDYTLHGQTHQVYFEFTIGKWWCNDIQFANIKVTDGICRKDGEIPTGRVSSLGSMS